MNQLNYFYSTGNVLINGSILLSLGDLIELNTFYKKFLVCEYIKDNIEDYPLWKNKNLLIVASNVNELIDNFQINEEEALNELYLEEEKIYNENN